MEKENRLDKFWQSIATLISPVIGLVAVILQIIDWLRDAEKMRYVSLALFLIALATALWFAQQAWEQKRGKRLVAILAALFLICCGYAFLWGARIIPRPPGCWYHDLHITSPLDGSTVQADVVEVKGSWFSSARKMACSTGPNLPRSSLIRSWASGKVLPTSWPETLR